MVMLQTIQTECCRCGERADKDFCAGCEFSLRPYQRIRAEGLALCGECGDRGVIERGPMFGYVRPVYRNEEPEICHECPRCPICGVEYRLHEDLAVCP